MIHHAGLGEPLVAIPSPTVRRRLIRNKERFAETEGEGNSSQNVANVGRQGQALTGRLKFRVVTFPLSELKNLLYPLANHVLIRADDFSDLNVVSARNSHVGWQPVAVLTSTYQSYHGHAEAVRGCFNIFWMTHVRGTGLIFMPRAIVKLRCAKMTASSPSQPLVAIVGATGTGKSQVKAGVLLVRVAAKVTD